MTDIQIKSKKRVADFGEVYTNEQEVNAMLDSVKDMFIKIDSTFLEPAAGNGNFLVEILKRKIEVVKKKYKKSQFEYERYAFITISTIYGIDILEDNVHECRERLYKVFNVNYTSLYKNNCSDKIRQSIKYVLSKNIICGDSLTGLKNGEEAEPIMFSEWTIFHNYVERLDFAMCDLLVYEKMNTKKILIPKPRKIFTRTDFREVSTLG